MHPGYAGQTGVCCACLWPGLCRCCDAHGGHLRGHPRAGPDLPTAQAPTGAPAVAPTGWARPPHSTGTCGGTCGGTHGLGQTSPQHTQAPAGVWFYSCTVVCSPASLCCCPHRAMRARTQAVSNRSREGNVMFLISMVQLPPLVPLLPRRVLLQQALAASRHHQAPSCLDPLLAPDNGRIWTN